MKRPRPNMTAPLTYGSLMRIFSVDCISLKYETRIEMMLTKRSRVRLLPCRVHDLVIRTADDLPESGSRGVRPEEIVHEVSIDAVDVRVKHVGGVLLVALD